MKSSDQNIVTYDNPAKGSLLSGNKLNALKIFVAFALPPIGLLLILYLLTSKNQKKLMMFFALLLAVVAGVLVYLKFDSFYLKGLNNYQYKPVSAKSTTTTYVGGLSFEKPNEFKQTHKSTQKDNTAATFSHTNDSGYNIGFIGVYASPSNLASDKKYNDGIKLLMKQSNGTEYDKYVGYFKDFVKGFNGSDYNVELSQPRQFVSTNIKDKAWVFDINAVTPDNKYSPLQGQFVYVIGDKGIYYFAVTALKSNWSDNSAVWRQVEDSIKVQ